MTPFESSTRHLFFTGKGGVGKTALACAAAISLADRWKRVLLVSTDPASNLDEMLGVRLGGAPTAVPGVPGLEAMNIDPAAAADAYRERVISPYLGIKSDDEIRAIREQLSGACTTEIAAFDQFAGLIGGADAAGFDHVVFDTAPTGHTLRLLRLPRAWTEFLDTNTRGASCLGPHSGLTMRHERFAAAMRALADESRTTIFLVTRPDAAALREAERSSGELRDLGVRSQRLAVNAVFHATDRGDPVALAFEQRGARALEEMPEGLRALPRFDVPLRGFNMVGLAALRSLLDDKAAPALAAGSAVPAELPALSTLIDELARADHALVMVMGKGGVGKTTVAAAVAIGLAARGIPVHLSTTDPAAHLTGTIAGSVENLRVSRIDPAAETRSYMDRVLTRKGRDLDAEGKALLENERRRVRVAAGAGVHARRRQILRKEVRACARVGLGGRQRPRGAGSDASAR